MLERITAFAVHPQDPRFIGHMDSLSTLSLVIADCVSSAINNNMVSREMSSAFSDMEDYVVSETAQRFGFRECGAGE